MLLDVLTYPLDQYDERAIDKKIILELIKKHEAQVLQLQKNMDYYLGEHEILDRKREGANNRVVGNHAKDITDTATGFFMGNAITYDNTGTADIEPLLKAFDEAEVDEVDHDNSLDMSIYGVAYEYIYAKEGSTELAIKNLEPENTFIVYDDTIEQRELFAVYWYRRLHSVVNKTTYVANVFTENLEYNFVLEGDSKVLTDENPEPIEHLSGEVPIIKYQNNKFCIGDYQQQIPLIDAYNMLMSSRVNDKEQFIDAILLLYGSQLADDEEEAKEAAKALKRDKMLELPIDAKAEYLTRALDEQGSEVLRKAIKEDIYTFSHVPNLSDEKFAGNTSGVAMEYKLLGLQMITKIKERYYKKGLKKRIRIFCRRLGLTSIEVDANSIVPAFTRGLPKNLLEVSQVIANLDGKVSDKQLLSLLPFIEDPDDELKEVEKQAVKRLTRQQELMSQFQANNPLVRSGEDDEEEPEE